MKKMLLHVLSLLAIGGAAFCMLYRPGSDAQGSALNKGFEKPFWKRDKYFIPKSSLRNQHQSQGLMFSDEVIVFQTNNENARCLLGQFLFVGHGKKHFILRGIKTFSGSKLEQHLLANNRPIYFEIIRKQEAQSTYERCKNWMSQ